MRPYADIQVEGGTPAKENIYRADTFLVVFLDARSINTTKYNEGAAILSNLCSPRTSCPIREKEREREKERARKRESKRECV